MALWLFDGRTGGAFGILINHRADGINCIYPAGGPAGSNFYKVKFKRKFCKNCMADYYYKQIIQNIIIFVKYFFITPAYSRGYFYLLYGFAWFTVTDKSKPNISVYLGFLECNTNRALEFLRTASSMPSFGRT